MARSLLHLNALATPELRALVSAVASQQAPPALRSRGAIAVWCARPAPFVRAALRGGAALLGLDIALYTPDEVAVSGDARLAGARLSNVHPAIVGVGLPAGTLAQLAQGATVPVVNGGDPDGDPIGALADLAFYQRALGGLEGRRLTWVGDSSGLLYDLLVGGGALGLSVAVAHPVGFAPVVERLTLARERAAESGAAVLVTTELAEAMVDASVVVVEPWPEEHVERFRPFLIQRHTLREAHPGALVVHRRPESRGPELSASFDEEVAAHAVAQHRARVYAAAVVLGWALRPDPLVSVVG